MERVVDLRSDTVTRPTPEMRRAMAEAEVGDDVYREDPTVRRLEELAAEKLGKEAGLFVTSGTMGNQVAVLTHTGRGDEVLVESSSHIFLFEAGGIALLSGAQPRPIPGRHGILDPEEVRRALRPPNIHYPPTSLLCVENTHNRGGGTVTTVQRMRELASVAHQAGLAVHLDGARIFNAAVALGVEAAELAGPADSVMFCLSKGLAAPVGSVLVGDREWIERARKWRKVLGGGLRQAGVLAAAGIVALEKMVDRLAEDHANARLLAEGLVEIPGISLDLDTVQTNIVIFDLDPSWMDASTFAGRLAELGVKCGAIGPQQIRMVTHKDVSREDVQYALGAVRRLARE